MTPDAKALAGQAAIVTGGGGGIGGASAAWLPRGGAAGGLMGRTAAALRAARHQILQIPGAGARGAYLGRDALAEVALRDAMTHAAGMADRLGIAVSVIGGGTMKPLLMFDGPEVMSDLERNIVSAFLVIRNATPFMATAGSGSIVCISSDAA